MSDNVRSIWRLIQRTVTPWRLPLWQRLAIAAAVAVAAVLLRAGLLGNEVGYPFLTAFPTVFGVTLVLGVKAGIAALVVITPLVQYAFVEPLGVFVPTRLGDVVALLVFIVACGGLIAVIGAFQATLRQVAALNLRLAASDEEKGVLLRDVTHRVQNHLAALAAALRIQRRRAQDPSARQALASVEGRVLALGRINARLAYRGGNASLDCKELLESLTEDIRAAGLGQGVTVELDVEDGHRLPIRQAVPIGLAVNELITNALKHAFPDGRHGTVGVRFLAEGAFYRLEVADDGIGCAAPQPAPEDGAGSGTFLLIAFSRQLGGTFNRERRAPSGTRCEVTFLRVPVDDSDDLANPRAA